VASRNGGASAAQAKVEDTKSVERILEESGGTGEPKQQTELNQKLGELLSLLKDNLASKAGGGSKASGEVVLPKHFTRDIAREVAGKVKESVLSSLRAAPAPSSAERVALQEEGAEKIPLDDVQGIIDRLTGKG
jgi:hypothetical protein